MRMSGEAYVVDGATTLPESVGILTGAPPPPLLLPGRIVREPFSWGRGVDPLDCERRSSGRRCVASTLRLAATYAACASKTNHEWFYNEALYMNAPTLPRSSSHPTGQHTPARGGMPACRTGGRPAPTQQRAQTNNAHRVQIRPRGGMDG
jgi:hypothetical protein